MSEMEDKVIGGLGLTQNNVPVILDALRAKEERLRMELANVQQRISFVQSTCMHPDREKRSSQGRLDHTRCTYCGKEW